MLMATEQAHAGHRDLDCWSTPEVLAAILTGQRQALAAAEAALPAIAAAADAIAARLKAGGRMIYAGAGSSGLQAHVDASEIPGTYGIEPDRVPVLMAGGRAAIVALDQGDEDDAEHGVESVDALEVGPLDAVVALSASGHTPFTVAALQRAIGRGALAVAVACNEGTPLLDLADHRILLSTPAEVIAGSTRMAAGTAQKCVLNMLSTAIGLRLGHGYAGLMVNLQADNAKLRRRAVAIVAEAAGADLTRAAQALEEAGAIKPAILMCRGASRSEAVDLLASSAGDVRAALGGLPARAGSHEFGSRLPPGRSHGAMPHHDTGTQSPGLPDRRTA